MHMLMMLIISVHVLMLESFVRVPMFKITVGMLRRSKAAP